MNIANIIDEIGIFETNMQIEKYIFDDNLLQELSKEIPISKTLETNTKIKDVAKKLICLNKENLFFLSNEISLIEELTLYKFFVKNIIVGLSRNLSLEQINNIKNNVSTDIKVSFVEELLYPTIIQPRNSLIIAFGYIDGNNCLVTKNTYRMLEIYKSFLGKKIFVRCIRENIKDRIDGLISINANEYFDMII